MILRGWWPRWGNKEGRMILSIRPSASGLVTGRSPPEPAIWATPGFPGMVNPKFKSLRGFLRGMFLRLGKLLFQIINQGFQFPGLVGDEPARPG